MVKCWSHPMHIGGSLPFNKKEWVIKEWPMCNRAITVSSFLFVRVRRGARQRRCSGCGKRGGGKKRESCQHTNAPLDEFWATEHQFWGQLQNWTLSPSTVIVVRSAREFRPLKTVKVCLPVAFPAEKQAVTCDCINCMYNQKAKSRVLRMLCLCDVLGDPTPLGFRELRVRLVIRSAQFRVLCSFLVPQVRVALASEQIHDVGGGASQMCFEAPGSVDSWALKRL